MKLTSDQLEFLISQHLDGTLNPVERAGLEEVLANDPGARALLDEYRKLDAVVKSAIPAPEVQWDQLAASISAETDKLEAPIRHYRLTFASVSKIAALAAMIAIAVGVIVKLRPPGSTTVETGTSVAVNATPLDVQISAPPVLTAAAITEISIGQPSGLAVADYSADVMSRPFSLWMIASGGNSAQDSEPSLY